MTTTTHPVAELSRPNPFAALFQEIAEIAQQMLRHSSYFELRDIACEFSGGILTLRGRVPSYHLKQLAQTCVSGVPGVVEIRNRVEVGNSQGPKTIPWRERESFAFASSR